MTSRQQAIMVAEHHEIDLSMRFNAYYNYGAYIAELRN